MRDHGEGQGAKASARPPGWPESAALERAAAPAQPARRFWAYFLLLVMGVVWGCTFSLAKIATEGGAHPLGLSLWQGAIGGAIMLGICLMRRRTPRLSRRHVGFYTLCALLGTVIPGTLFFYAAPHVPAGILAITVAIVPILTYAMTLGFKVDALSPGRALGILLGLASVVLLVLPEAALPDRAMVPWVLVAVLASGFYAGENIYVALCRPEGSDTLAIITGMLFMASVLLTPVVLATGTFMPLALPWGPVEWAAVAMAAASALAYTLYLYVIQTAGPVFASQTAYTVTIAGVFWGMAIFGERHSWWIWASLAVMLAGLALVAPRAKGRR